MKASNKMVFGYLVGGFLVIVIFPSLIYLASLLVDKFYRVEITPNVLARWIIIVLLVSNGVLFGGWSIIVQNVIGKGGPVEVFNVEISPKTKNLVVSGPYKYSRNPMLFGTFSAYGALAVFINSLNAVLAVFLFIIVMIVVVVKTEEKRLVKDFGNLYIEYRRRTSMLIPWFPKLK